MLGKRGRGRPMHWVYGDGHFNHASDPSDKGVYCAYCDKYFKGDNVPPCLRHLVVCEYASKELVEKCEEELAKRKDKKSSLSLEAEDQAAPPTKKRRVMSEFLEEEDKRKEKEQKDVEETIDENVEGPDGSQEESGSFFTTPCKRPNKKSTQSSMKSFVTTTKKKKGMTPQDIEQARVKLCRGIFYQALPFSLVENPHFRHLFHQLNPFFKLPDRHDVAAKYLQYEEKRLRAKMWKKLGTVQHAVVGIDGSADGTKNPVEHAVLLLPEPIFFGSYRLGTNKATSENILALVEQVKEEVSSTTENKCKIVGVATDNEPKMVKVRADYIAVNPQDAAIGCAAHAADLIVGDLMKHEYMKPTLENCSTILKSAKNTKFRQEMKEEEVKAGNLTENQQYGVPMPGETRWNSWIDSLEWLIKKKQLLRALAVREETRMHREVKRLVLSDIFWTKTSKMTKVLKSFGVGLDKLQADTSASVAFRVFSDWYDDYGGEQEEMEPDMVEQNNLQEGDEEEIPGDWDDSDSEHAGNGEAIGDEMKEQEAADGEDDDDHKELSAAERRFNTFVHGCIGDRYELFTQGNGAFKASHAVDARYRHKRMVLQDVEDGKIFLKGRIGSRKWREKNVDEQFEDFRIGRGVFGRKEWELGPKDDPRVPWEELKNDKVYKYLARGALLCLSLPCGIAGVERSFNPIRKLHKWDRASLGPETLDMLVFVYSNLRWLQD